MSEAAAQLGITQPVLSESVKRLETDCGRVLFYRTRAGISLTPAGRQMFERARSVVSSVAMMSGAAEEAVSITIGAHPMVASYFLPAALAKIRGPRVSLRHGLSREVQTDIQQGRVDVGLVVNAVPSPDLVIRKFAEDKFGVFSTRGDFDRAQIICSPSLQQTQSILRRWKARPSRLMESENLDLIAHLAASGLGYALLPERAVRKLRLPLVRVAGSPEFRDIISLVHRPEFGHAPAERALLTALRESAE